MYLNVESEFEKKKRVIEEKLNQGTKVIVLNEWEGIFYEDFRIPLEVMEIYENDLFFYWLKHGEYDWSIPYAIRDGGVLVNFFGILATKKKLIGFDEYKEITLNPKSDEYYDREWFVLDEQKLSLNEFAES